MFGIRRKLQWLARRSYALGRLPRALRRPLALEELISLKLSPNAQYYYCLHYFDHYLPPVLREHRAYFLMNGRGFGEDSFHAMWHLLMDKFRPSCALEIGVYRGQTVSLWKLISQQMKFECQVSCVSPFSSAGDSVSNYASAVDYYTDMKANHEHFNLPLPAVCREYSTSQEAKRFMSSRDWDMIYIDGNHEYEIARQDWEICSTVLKPGGTVILDDSALNTDYHPPCFATAGHPGPSRLAREIDPLCFKEIFSVGHNRVFQKLR